VGGVRRGARLDGVAISGCEHARVVVVVFKRCTLVCVIVLVFGPLEVVSVSFCLGYVPSVVSVFHFR
jgi:hypothetical protein